MGHRNFFCVCWMGEDSMEICIFVGYNAARKGAAEMEHNKEIYITDERFCSD